MREGQFIKQNKDRWNAYEAPTDDPDEMAKRFTSLVDDLSYAKTFYPFGNTVKYLNSLAANIYLSIYKNRREKSNRIVTFWTRELPLIIRRQHRFMLYSLLFFAAFIILGVLSSKIDQTFVRSILGDGYVDRTETNIANGDPFGIYKDSDAFMMYIEIALNNIVVSFFCFMLGVTASIGTLYFLMQNGLMLGVFEYMFFKHGKGLESLMTIFIHGTLEISALVIAGGAGLALGNALFFPRTFTRFQAIKQAAKDGTKIQVALIPVYMTAAFFESYVTRHTEMPLALRIAILGGSLLFVVFYFIIQPIRMGKKYGVVHEIEA